MCPAARADDPATAAPHLAKPGWIERHRAKLQQIASGKVDLILLGDTITQELDDTDPPHTDINAVWRHYYGCRHAVNLGFAGDSTSNLLWRVQNGEVAGIAPRLAVLMIGTSLGKSAVGRYAQAQESGILAVVDELHRRLPATHILVLGIPPNGRGAAAGEERTAINALSAAHDWSPLNAEYLSVDSVFMKDGAPDPSLYLNGANGRNLRPNAAGWDALAQIIEPKIATYVPIDEDRSGHKDCKVHTG